MVVNGDEYCITLNRAAAFDTFTVFEQLTYLWQSSTDISFTD